VQERKVSEREKARTAAQLLAVGEPAHGDAILRDLSVSEGLSPKYLRRPMCVNPMLMAFQ